MTWLRIDDRWFTNPKIVQAGGDGRQLWLAAACYAAGGNTGGIVHHQALPMLAASVEVPPSTTDRLVDIALWHTEGTLCASEHCPAHTTPVPSGAWAIHDWWAYQPRPDVEQARTDRARNAANTRWARERDTARTPRPRPADARSNAQALHDEQCPSNAYPSRPVPSSKTNPPTNQPARDPAPPPAGPGSVGRSTTEAGALNLEASLALDWATAYACDVAPTPIRDPLRYRASIRTRLEAEHHEQLHTAITAGHNAETIARTVFGLGNAQLGRAITRTSA